MKSTISQVVYDDELGLEEAKKKFKRIHVHEAKHDKFIRWLLSYEINLKFACFAFKG